ncbi:MAG: hypothetical protein IPN71_08435 [Fibrobacteres bacterium]|nr:hypothetical protein [Fibrobacterota bacterium]
MDTRTATPKLNSAPVAAPMLKPFLAPKAMPTTSAAPKSVPIPAPIVAPSPKKIVAPKPATMAVVKSVPRPAPPAAAPPKHALEFLAEDAGQPILDWLTMVATVEYTDPTESSAFAAADFLEAAFNTADVRCNRDGTVTKSGISRKLRSPTTNATARVIGSSNRLLLKGNPTQWLQGHNAYCPCDPRLVAKSAYVSWIRCLTEMLSAADRTRFRVSASHISTLHLAKMYEAGTVLTARQVLEDLQANSRCGKRRRELDEHGVYHGKSSKQAAIKIYLDEGRSSDGTAPEGVAGTCIRIEVVMHDERLENYFGPKGGQLPVFARTILSSVFDAECSELRVVAGNATKVAMPVELTDSQLGVYTRWFHRVLDRAKAKLRHHREAILDLVGVDIYLPRVESDSNAMFEKTPVLEWLFQRDVTNKYGRSRA